MANHDALDRLKAALQDRHSNERSNPTRHIWLRFSAISVALLLASACAPEGESDPAASAESEFDAPAEEAAIREVWDEIIAMFNGHDAGGWAALFDESFVRWEGDVKGPAAEEAYMAEFFEHQPDVEYGQLDEIGLVFVTPEVAIYRTFGQVSNVVGSDGSRVPPNQILEGWIFVKRSDSWKVATYFLRPVEASE
jgi:hypothetical protein